MLERRNDFIRYAKAGILGGTALALGTACIPGVTSPAETPTPDALSALLGGRRADSTPTPGVVVTASPDYRATATSLQAENDRLRANATSTVVAGGKETTAAPTQVARVAEAPRVPVVTLVPAAPAKEGEHPVPGCRQGPGLGLDGRNIQDLSASVGQVLPRTPVGAGELSSIADMSWNGPDFGGYRRAVVVTRSQGEVWQFNAREGLRTLYTRVFCGWPQQLVQWALDKHVTQLQKVSRDEVANQPQASEIGVFETDYENGFIVQHKLGSESVEEMAKRFDLSFREKGRTSNQPLRGVVAGGSR